MLGCTAGISNRNWVFEEQDSLHPGVQKLIPRTLCSTSIKVLFLHSDKTEVMKKINWNPNNQEIWKIQKDAGNQGYVQHFTPRDPKQMKQNDTVHPEPELQSCSQLNSTCKLHWEHMKFVSKFRILQYRLLMKALVFHRCISIYTLKGTFSFETLTKPRKPRSPVFLKNLGLLIGNSLLPGVQLIYLFISFLQPKSQLILRSNLAYHHFGITGLPQSHDIKKNKTPKPTHLLEESTQLFLSSTMKRAWKDPRAKHIKYKMSQRNWLLRISKTRD